MKAILLAAAIVLAGSGAASAVPAMPQSGAQTVDQPGLLHLVRDRDHHHGRSHHHRHHRHHWRRHHDRYHGWHRYHSRPYDWRSRRCVMVGPLWMCP